MRDADRRECGAFGHSPTEALTGALRSSLWAVTAMFDGEPHAMLGVTPRNMMEGSGVPWMLGTERIYDSGREMVRYAPAILREMFDSFTVLENYVAADNARAVRFLRWLDFEIYEPVVNIGGVPFKRFSRCV